MQIVIATLGACYKYVEDGRLVSGQTECAIFDQDTADKVLRQIPAFCGDTEFFAIPLVTVRQLVEKFKTKAEAARRIGCSPSTIYKWSDAVGFRYQLAAYRALNGA